MHLSVFHGVCLLRSRFAPGAACHHNTGTHVATSTGVTARLVATLPGEDVRWVACVAREVSVLVSANKATLKRKRSDISEPCFGDSCIEVYGSCIVKHTKIHISVV